MREYPVHVTIESPVHFDRSQLLVRLLIAIALGIVGITGNVVVGGLYVVLPAAAAIMISSGRGDYLAEPAAKLWRGLAWVLRISAYLMLVTDRFPSGDDAIRPTVERSGRPTVGSALGRLLTSIPSALVLGLAFCLSTVLSFVGAITILVARSVPHWVLAYQRGVLRWQANLLAYHASMVEAYPPFALDTDEGDERTGGVGRGMPDLQRP